MNLKMEKQKLAQWIEEIMNGNFKEKIIEISDSLNGLDDVILFSHFIANILPWHILNQITNKKFSDILEFNHFANDLAFKFSK